MSPARSSEGGGWTEKLSKLYHWLSDEEPRRFLIDLANAERQPQPPIDFMSQGVGTPWQPVMRAADPMDRDKPTSLKFAEMKGDMMGPLQGPRSALRMEETILDKLLDYVPHLRLGSRAQPIRHGSKFKRYRQEVRGKQKLQKQHKEATWRSGMLDKAKVGVREDKARLKAAIKNKKKNPDAELMRSRDPERLRKQLANSKDAVKAYQQQYEFLTLKQTLEEMLEAMVKKSADKDYTMLEGLLLSPLGQGLLRATSGNEMDGVRLPFTGNDRSAAERSE